MSNTSLRNNWVENSWVGLHYDMHAQADAEDVQAAVTHDHLREMWSLIRPDFINVDCKGVHGLTSWPAKSGNAAPGLVRDRDPLRIQREVAREMGIPLVMHYCALWDNRAVTVHPDWAVVLPDGTRNNDVLCLMSPHLDEVMLPELKQLIEDYDVDGFWFDADVWHSLPSYSENYVRAFAKATGIEVPPMSAADPGWAEWVRFHGEVYEERARRIIAFIKELKPECNVWINWAYTYRMPLPISAPVDGLSGDFPFKCGPESIALETRYTATRGLPWNMMAWTFSSYRPFGQPPPEKTPYALHTKPLRNLCMDAACTIAQGGAVLLYEYLPCTGYLTRWRHERFAQVADFCRERRAYCEGTETVPDTLVLHDSGNHYRMARRVLDLDHVEGDVEPAVRGAVLALLSCGHSVDLRDERGMEAHLAGYPLVVLASQTHLQPKTRATLEDYVRNGGTLVINGAEACAEWAAFAGLNVLESMESPPWPGRLTPDWKRTFWLPHDGESVPVAGPWLRLESGTGRSLLPLLKFQEPVADEMGCPAAVVCEVGKGRVLAIVGPLFESYDFTRYGTTLRVIGELMAAVGEHRPVHIKAHPVIEMSLRRKPGALLVQLVNRGSLSVQSAITSTVEDTPPVPGVEVEARVPARPSSVLLQPGDRNVPWTYENGTVHAGPFTVDLHDILEIRQ